MFKFLSIIPLLINFSALSCTKDFEIVERLKGQEILYIKWSDSKKFEKCVETFVETKGGGYIQDICGDSIFSHNDGIYSSLKRIKRCYRKNGIKAHHCIRGNVQSSYNWFFRVWTKDEKYNFKVKPISEIYDYETYCENKGNISENIISSKVNYKVVNTSKKFTLKFIIKDQSKVELLAF